ncbi:hypothetical protein KC220_27640, partial [Mycobacterium tuberculosis]|nr:hypothetical protein [Mycobacterium tuberculosis]
WRADGLLAAAGMADLPNDPEGKNILRLFGASGKKAGGDTTVSLNTVMGIRPCGNGIIYGSADPMLGLVDGGSQATVLQ